MVYYCLCFLLEFMVEFKDIMEFLEFDESGFLLILNFDFGFSFEDDSLDVSFICVFYKFECLFFMFYIDFCFEEFCFCNKFFLFLFIGFLM